MTEENNQKPENKNKTTHSGHWIDKAEALIDDAAEKIHQSDAYQEAGKAVESATKTIFRKAGRWWGKYSKK